jgi:hypothetical protein
MKKCEITHGHIRCRSDNHGDPQYGHHEGIDANLRQMFAILLILPMVEGRLGKHHQGAAPQF